MPARSNSPIRASSAAAADLGNPLVNTGRNEVRSHEAVRARPTDGEGLAGQQPKSRRAESLAERVQRFGHGIGGECSRSIDRVLGSTVRTKPKIGGTIAEEEGDERHDEHQCPGDDKRGLPPAELLDNPGQQRQEHELTCRRAGGQHARTSPRRVENQRLTTVAARTRAVIPVPSADNGPHKTMSCHGADISVVRATPVPTIVNEISTVRRTPSRPISCGGEGAHQAVEKQVQRHGRGNRRPTPAELPFQWDDQDTGGRPDTAARQENRDVTPATIQA